MTSTTATGAAAGPIGRVAGLVAWLGALSAVLAGALLLGTVPALAGPPLGDPASWGEWAGARQPVEAAFAVLRLVLVAVSCYLLAATLVASFARLARIGRLVAVTDVVTLPFVRRIVHGAIGVGMVGATVAAGASAASATSGPALARPAVVQVRLAAQVTDPGPTAAAPGGGGDAVDRPPPTLRRLDPLPVTDVPPTADPAPLPAPAGDRVGAPATAGIEVVVDAGDHLWSLAEGALEAAWGRAPSDAEVVGYWEQVIEANRARLADSANPDLVFPGQSLVLPPAPGAPAP